VCVEQDDWIRHGPGPGFCGGGAGQAKGSAVQYETVAEAFRDLERAGGRLALRSSCCPAGPDHRYRVAAVLAVSAGTSGLRQFGQ
jgi:hypothetical protein